MPNRKFDPKTIRIIARIGLKQLLLDMEQNDDYSPEMFKKVEELAKVYSTPYYTQRKKNLD